MKNQRYVISEIRGRIGLLTLNRPQVMNALSQVMMEHLEEEIDALEKNLNVSVIIVKGAEENFAVGADIRDFINRNYLENYLSDFISGTWERLARCRIPVIAAVAGYAMGAGCELAMMCDIIIAAETARFSQPELTIGLMPGAGGTQRLARSVGKAKAMDLCLTGRFMDAQEAEKAGLISRIVPLGDLLKESLAVAERIATFSRPVTMMIKEVINRSFELPLSEGIKMERRLFHSLFALQDPHEGIQAFLDKRSAQFEHK